MNKTSSNESMNPSRRRFLVTAAGTVVVGASGLLAPRAAQAQKRPRQGDALDISVFSKCLQWLDYAGTAGITAEAGFDGVDLTVRKGGKSRPSGSRRTCPRRSRPRRRPASTSA